MKNFDKMAKIGYGIARLVPGPIGTATNIIDMVKGNGDTGDILAAGNPAIETAADYKAKNQDC